MDEYCKRPIYGEAPEGEERPVIREEEYVCGSREEINQDLQAQAQAARDQARDLNERVAPEFLPRMVRRLRASGVEVRGCPRTRALVPDIPAATEADWDTEYLDLILSVKVVGSFEEAVGHIAEHGSGLAEAIVTADHSRAMRFLREVDAGAVFVNASTRFTDGGEFGMGAEMGISTQKLHARGPVGLTELTCQKFIVLGEGQIRDSRK